MANVNEGHRARLRSRMMKEGLDGFQDHEVLEMLLFQFLPRKDTNKLAHSLINRFGSFANVLDATPQQLMTVQGISEVTACNLAVLKEVWLRYRRSAAQKMSLAGLSSIIQYSRQLITESYTERLVVVYVDVATNFIVKEEFVSDNILSLNVDIRKIVTSAVNANASGVILFHCHVKGSCEPSREDIAFTEKLFNTLANLNIVLLEHIIFNGGSEYYSFFKEKQISKLTEAYEKKNSKV